MTSPRAVPPVVVDGAPASGRRSGRAPVAWLFGLFGAASGSWAGRIPWLSNALDLSPGELGLALFTPALGAVVMLPFAGRLTTRLGSRTAAAAAMAAFGVSVALPMLSPSLAVLCLALAGYGVAGAMLDVTVNAAGVETERRSGRSVMSGLHAMWSIGALVGAATAGLVAAAGVDAPVHLAVVGAVTAVGGPVVARRLVPTPGAAPGGRTFALPGRGLVALGVVGFCSFFAEAAMADWSAVFLAGARGASEGVAASGYAVFSVCMAAGRLAGDRLVDRWGRGRVVGVSGAAAAAGLLLAAAVPSLAAAWVGFGMAGLGLATVIPLAFAAAGHRGDGAPGRVGGTAAGPADPDRAAPAIAAVATLSYLGWLAGPALIGGVASLTSLPVALGLTAVLVGCVVPLSRALR